MQPIKLSIQKILSGKFNLVVDFIKAPRDRARVSRRRDRPTVEIGRWVDKQVDYALRERR